MKDSTTIQIAISLRLRALALKPDDIGRGSGASNDSSANSVWGSVFGVIVEMAYPDAVTTLVALTDGSVSLYVSDGNGCIGCGQHREVRTTANEMLAAASRLFDISQLTESTDAPKPGDVCIYLLAQQGLRSMVVSLDRINEVDPRFGSVYFAGQRLMATIERVGAGHSLMAEINRALGVEEHPASGAEQCLSVGNAVRRLQI